MAGVDIRAGADKRVPECFEHSQFIRKPNPAVSYLKVTKFGKMFLLHPLYTEQSKEPSEGKKRELS